MVLYHFICIFTFHLSDISFHKSNADNHLHLSLVPCPLSLVPCPLSPVLSLCLPYLYFKCFSKCIISFLELAIDKQRELIKKLNACECRDIMEEIDILVNILTGKLMEEERLIYSRRVLHLLRKFAFRKYRREFESVLMRLSELSEDSPELFARVGKGLTPLARLAAARFNG